MNKLFIKLEIAFWDKAISLMSQEKTPRVYSQTLAAMTLCLKPEIPRITRHHIYKRKHIFSHQWIRLAVIAMMGLLLGLVLGWLQAS